MGAAGRGEAAEHFPEVELAQGNKLAEETPLPFQINLLVSFKTGSCSFDSVSLTHRISLPRNQTKKIPHKM